MLLMVTVIFSDVVGKWLFLCFDNFFKVSLASMHFGRDFVFFSLFNSTFNAFKEKCMQFPKGDGFWSII